MRELSTTLSTKGQIVVPGAVRRRLALQPGQRLRVTIEGDSVRLTPERPPASTARTVRSAASKLPVLSFGRNAPVVTSADVAGLLSDFP